MEASPLPGSFRASPYPPRQAPPKRIGWRMAVHESRALLFTITVRAFIRCRTTMPSADFCCEIRAPCDTLSHDFATHSRSPEVSSTAFRTQPPDLQPVPLMDMGFAVIGQLARHRMPQIRFLYIGSYACSTLLSDPASRRRPCASLSLHLHQVVKRTFTFELSNMLGTLAVGIPVARYPPHGSPRAALPHEALIVDV
jgi:hypothetical protein